MIIIQNQFAIAWHSPHAAGVFQVVINHQIDAWHIQGSRATRSVMLVRVQRPGTIEGEFWSDPFERPQNMDKMNKLKSQAVKRRDIGTFSKSVAPLYLVPDLILAPYKDKVWSKMYKIWRESDAMSYFWEATVLYADRVRASISRDKYPQKPWWKAADLFTWGFCSESVYSDRAMRLFTTILGIPFNIF